MWSNKYEGEMLVEIILIFEWYRKLNINIHTIPFSQVKSQMESLLIILAFEVEWRKIYIKKDAFTPFIFILLEILIRRMLKMWAVSCLLYSLIYCLIMKAPWLSRARAGQSSCWCVYVSFPECPPGSLVSASHGRGRLLLSTLSPTRPDQHSPVCVF